MPAAGRRVWTLVLALIPLAGAAGGAPAPDAPALYAEHCAHCHGETRLGGSGPALLPGNLGRLRPADAVRIIAEGAPASQMPAFRMSLSSHTAGPRIHGHV